MGPEISIILALLDRAIQWGAVVKKAHDEGRRVSEAEIDAFVAQDNDADQRLQDAITRARAEGR
jgi:hypothetical protein